MQLKTGRIFKLILAAIIVAVGLRVGYQLAQSTALLSEERRAIGQTVDDVTFNFAIWEVGALTAKIQAALVSAPSFIEPAAQKQLVLDYAAAVSDVRRLQRELEQQFATDENAESNSQELQQQLAQRRADVERMQNSAEGVLEQQVTAILDEEGFDLADFTFPPVQSRMTPLPLMLIVSPRDRIEQIYAFPLEHGLTIAEQEQLESIIYESEDVSALIVPIGGLGIYPAMIVETGNINFLADVFAHEWAHHWLTFRPLGFNYGTHPQTRIINETVASVLGTEVGERVIERYYPELVPPPPAPPAQSSSEDGAEPVEPNPPRFDFRATMRDTRIGTDALLAEGKIAEAEAFMEAQRQLFVEEGYLLRKINQAYFAFYGAYADQPGATGGDPIGPTVLAVRDVSPSLKVFMDEVADVTQLPELEALLERLEQTAEQ